MSYLPALVIYYFAVYVCVVVAIMMLDSPYLLIAAGMGIHWVADLVAKPFVPSKP
jgi:hypothetical protein